VSHLGITPQLEIAIEARRYDLAHSLDTEEHRSDAASRAMIVNFFDQALPHAAFESNVVRKELAVDLIAMLSIAVERDLL
jgi:hypothetical protein